MTDTTNTQYAFVPAIRQGLATCITESVENSDVGKKQRIHLEAELLLEVNGDTEIQEEPITKKIELMGPGDVLGFVEQSVSWTEPKNNVGDFEPNYFPMMEFNVEPDFLWRFTHEPANSNGDLKPWVVLVVLSAENVTESDVTIDKEIQQEGRFAATEIPYVKTNTSHLPDLSESYRWAHVQVTSGESEVIDLDQVVQNQSERVVSRLLCPRRLRPGMKYFAYVVPAFELGRLRAAGESVIESNATALTPSWDIATSTDIELPYYYRWEFRTGLRGDFEHLARLLELRSADSLGKSQVDCKAPGFGLDGPDILDFESVFMDVNAEPTPWGKDSSSDDGIEFRKDLAEKLNDTIVRLEDDEDPVIVAPMYGRWHRDREELKSEADDWFNELNLDPRHRAVAAVGAEIVRKNQESLMASAWDQIGEAEEVNEILRRAQFARAVGSSMQKRLDMLSESRFAQVTAPVHGRLPTMAGHKKSTVKNKFADSVIGPVSFDRALTKIARKRGAVMKRQQETTQVQSMVQRMSRGGIQTREPKAVSDGLINAKVTTDKLIEIRTPHIEFNQPKIVGSKVELIFQVHKAQGGNIQIHDSDLPNGFIISPLSASGEYKIIGDVDLSKLISRTPVSFTVKESSQLARSFTQELTIVKQGAQPKLEEVRSIEHSVDDANSDQWFFEEKLTASRVHEKLADLEPGTPQYEAGEGIQTALMGSLKFKKRQPENQGYWINLEDDSAEIKEALSVEKTIQTKINENVMLPMQLPTADAATAPAGKAEAIEPIRVAPEFPQSLFESVEEISQDLILKNIKDVPQNSVIPLQVNRRFIEAFFAGINHEFSQELLWREFPSDQRGSYFRQFFNVDDYEPSSAEIYNAYNDFLSDNKIKDPMDTSSNGEWKDEDLERIIELHDYMFTDHSTLSNREKAKLILEQIAIEDKLKDVPPLHTWDAIKLGENNVDSNDANHFIVLIRGDLLKKYPNSLIYLVDRGLDPDSADEFVPKLSEFGHDDGQIINPLFSVQAKPDITFLGFNIDRQTAVDQGWYFVIQERVSETRFGLDVSNDTALDGWPNLSWDNFDLFDGFGRYLGKDKPTNNIGTFVTDAWEGASSAWIAAKTLQKPMRICISVKQLMAG